MSSPPERIVILDTETTGLSADLGHRILEIGCVEITNRRLSGRNLHLYLNPEREVDEAATEVHGMRWEDLRDKPRFAEVVDLFRDFVSDSRVLIHNAPFDESFLDREFDRLGLPRFAQACRAEIACTLRMARELHPGKRNSLDALCERYGVSHAHRKLHGALLDAELLAEVYLAMTRGQESLEIVLDGGTAVAEGETGPAVWPPSGLSVLAANETERAAHEALLGGLEKDARAPALWRRTA